MSQEYIDEPIDYFTYPSGELHYSLYTVLKQTDLSGKFLFLLDYRILLENKDIPYDLVKEKYDYANALGKKFFFVIECMSEAQTYFYNLIFIDNRIKKVMELCNLEPYQIINLSGAHDISLSPYQHCTSITQFGLGPEVVNTFATNIPKHHFVSLSNQPRRHRVIATVDIWDRQLEQFGFVSLNLTPPPQNSPNIEFVTEKYWDRLPCFIDGPSIGIEHYKLRNPETEFAFINLVHETSIEYGVCNFSWHSIFLTEKSIKPFAWGQVPIFNTIKNHVKKVREFGFDMFDDLIDHSYDDEIDPYKRIKMGVDQLEKICRTMTLDDIQTYKRNNMDRFIRNRKLAEDHLHSPNSLNVKITADNLTRCLNDQP